MPSQPPPDSTGGSPRTSAPFQSAPGSTAGIPQTPAALSAQIVRRIARKCTELVDWWLERMEGEEGQIRVAGKAFTPQMSDQMRKGASSSNMKVAGRVFRSSAIVKHHDCTTIESEDGCPIRLAGPFNITKTRENGFSEKVCKSFKFGFPDIWQRLVNPKMVPDNEHARSPSETTTGAPSPSVEAYMAYFLSDSFSSSITYDYDLTEYRAKIRSVVNERYRSTVGCGQAEEDADIQQENMHSCSSEHGMVPLPIDCTSSQFGATDALELPTEGMTPKFGAIGGSEASTCKRLRSRKAHGMPSGGPMKRGHKQKKIQHNQGATSTADLTPLENVGSEDSTCKRLRSGKVHGMPSGGPMKRGHKQKKIQQMVNQRATSTADLTSHVH